MHFCRKNRLMNKSSKKVICLKKIYEKSFKNIFKKVFCEKSSFKQMLVKILFFTKKKMFAYKD